MDSPTCACGVIITISVILDPPLRWSSFVIERKVEFETSIARWSLDSSGFRSPLVENRETEMTERREAVLLSVRDKEIYRDTTTAKFPISGESRQPTRQLSKPQSNT